MTDFKTLCDSIQSQKHLEHIKSLCDSIQSQKHWDHIISLYDLVSEIDMLYLVPIKTSSFINKKIVGFKLFIPDINDSRHYTEIGNSEDGCVYLSDVYTPCTLRDLFGDSVLKAETAVCLRIFKSCLELELKKSELGNLLSRIVYYDYDCVDIVIGRNRLH